MHFYAHVASKVFESINHVIDKFFIITGFVVTQKIIHNENKGFPCFRLKISSLASQTQDL